MLQGFKYNTLIRLGFEACLPLTVACFIAFKEEDRGTYVGLASQIIASVIFFLLCYLVAFNIKLIKTKRDKFGKDKELDKVFSSYYDNLKNDKVSQLYFNVVFMMERIAFSAALVFLTEYPLI